MHPATFKTGRNNYYRQIVIIDNYNKYYAALKSPAVLLEPLSFEERGHRP